jgi:transcriptional regulator with XRE-family HTH domain
MMVAMRGRTPATPTKEYPNRLREWRQVRGLSLKTLAERTQQKHQSVARHETGENQMTVAQLEVYAKVLRIKPEELLKNSLRVHPKLRGLVDLFESLPADEQDRFLRMGYAFVEPNVRYLAPNDGKPPQSEQAPVRRPHRRLHR